MQGGQHQDPTTTATGPVAPLAPVRREKRRPPSLFSAPPMIREATSSPSLLASSLPQQPAHQSPTANITRTTSSNNGTIPHTPMQQIALPPSGSIGPSSAYQGSTSGQLSDNPSFATNNTSINNTCVVNALSANISGATPKGSIATTNVLPPALDLSVPGSTTSQRQGGLTPIISAAGNGTPQGILLLGTPSLKQMPQFSTAAHRLSPSSLNPIVGGPGGSSQMGNMAHLSPDGNELRVGDFIVTRNGCATIKNHLLMNPIDAITMTPKLVPKATPQLRSTRLEDPISPLIYSNDAFPHDSVSIVGGGLLPAAGGNDNSNNDGVLTAANYYSISHQSGTDNANDGGLGQASTPTAATVRSGVAPQQYGWLNSPSPLSCQRDSVSSQPQRGPSEAAPSKGVQQPNRSVHIRLGAELGEKSSTDNPNVQSNMGSAITSNPSSNTFVASPLNSLFNSKPQAAEESADIGIGCRPLFNIDARRGTAVMSTGTVLPVPISVADSVHATDEINGGSTSNALITSTSSSVAIAPQRLDGTPPPPGGMVAPKVGVSIRGTQLQLEAPTEDDDRANCASPFASTLPIVIVPTDLKVTAGPASPVLRQSDVVKSAFTNLSSSPSPVAVPLLCATLSSQVTSSAPPPTQPQALRSPIVASTHYTLLGTPPLAASARGGASGPSIGTPSSSLPPLPPISTQGTGFNNNSFNRRPSLQAPGAVSPSSTYSRCSPTTTTGYNNPPTPFASLTGLAGSHNCFQLRYSDLEILGPIDKGASATVYKARHKETQKTFAVKCIDLSDLLEESGITINNQSNWGGGGSSHQLRISPKIRQLHHIVYRELQMLHSEYRSAHVLKMYDAFYDPDLCTLNICMEYMHWGSLVHLGFLMSPMGKHRVPLPERLLAVIAEQILHGLKDMHSKGHVHRDIKPGNVLVNSSGVVKLSDFGLVETISNIAKNEGEMDDGEVALCSGTDKYMSPERQKGERHGPPSDVWALGMTLAECAIGRYAVDTSKAKDGFERIELMSKVRYPPSIDLSRDFKDFVEQCMRPNANDRPTAAALLEHPLLSRWQGEYNLADKLQSAIKRQEAYEEDLVRNRRNSEHRRALQEEWAERYMDEELLGGGHGSHRGGKRNNSYLTTGKKKLSGRATSSSSTTPKTQQHTHSLEGSVNRNSSAMAAGQEVPPSPTMSSNTSSNHNNNNKLTPVSCTSTPTTVMAGHGVRTPTTTGGKRDRDKRKVGQFRKTGAVDGGDGDSLVDDNSKALNE